MTSEVIEKTYKYTIPTPNQLFELLQERLSNTTLPEKWISSEPWTATILRVFNEIGSSLGFKPRKEYLRLDQTWEIRLPDVSTIVLASEYENTESVDDILDDELQKLMDIKAFLKVLVFYPSIPALMHEGEFTIPEIQDKIRSARIKDPNEKYVIIDILYVKPQSVIEVVATYLQTLKETLADPTEAIRLRWIDLNGNSITVNRPVKNHNPRQVPITNQLASMLNMLPKTSEIVFNTTYGRMAERFRNMRRKVASNLQNPRILSITLRTFRHFGATMLYAQTRAILLVKKILGHKKIENTLKYTQLIHFKDDEYDTATATDIEEAKQLISSGFEYVTDMNGIKLFRKPKRFAG